jgi:hypothetical protein
MAEDRRSQALEESLRLGGGGRSMVPSMEGEPAEGFGFTDIFKSPLASTDPAHPASALRARGPSETLPTQHPARLEFERIQQEDFARLQDFYNRKAEQMRIKDPARRIQPRTQDVVIDNDYATPAPAPEGGHPDLRRIYPRHDPGARMPLNDRTRPLIQFADEIAQRYAQYIRQSGVMEQDTGRFYRVDGPIYRAGRKYGLSHEEAMKFLQDLSQYMAATSPRTQTEPNLLNASSAMAKVQAGIPHRQIIGPGSVNIDPETGRPAGISESGYPMMTSTNPSKPGIHGQLLDRVISGEGISHDTNTKPSIFAPNLSGNRSGVTVDTHIIRGLLLTMNDIHPGSIPIEWFAKDFRTPEAYAAYRANPESLTSDMLNDTLQTAQVGPRGASTKRQVEYPVFADILHRVAKILRVPQKDVADVQAMGWFGMGSRTNLGSDPKTVVDLLNERISVAAQMMGVTPDQAARMFFTRKLPLAALFGMAVGAGAGMGTPQKAEAAEPQTPVDDIVATMTKTPRPMSPTQFQALIDYMRSNGMGPPPRPANPVATLGVRG